MERLTKRARGFTTLTAGPPEDACRIEFCEHASVCKYVADRTCPYLRLIDRLADYEDLGPVDHLRELVEAEAALETRKGGDKG